MLAAATVTETAAPGATAVGVRDVRETWLAALRLVVVGVILTLFAWRALGGTPPIERFFDDFFYYLSPAETWLETGRIEYFPGEPTNGFHPIWFLWIAGLLKLTGEANTLFFAAVDASVGVLLVGGFLLFERTLRTLLGNPFAALVGAVAAFVQVVPYSATGVEMALVTFLVSALMWRLSRKPLADHTLGDAFVVGLIGSLAVLARLDAIVLAPLLLAVVWRRWDIRRLAATSVGAFPLALYLIVNIATTGHFTTTSSYAKSIDPHINLEVMFTWTLPEVWWYVVASILALGLLALGRARHMTADARNLALVLAAAPLVQFLLQDVFSGWYVFIWYLYFALLALGLFVGLTVVALLELKLYRLAPVAAMTLIALSAMNATILGRGVRDVQMEIAEIARWFESFSQTRPGVYAMGDGAGVPGWIVDQPIVHLEGLMMSHKFVERIHASRPLDEVLRDYGVQYLVVNNRDEELVGGCPSFSAPHSDQASVRAPKMSLATCAPPMAEFSTGPVYHARIFRIDPATGLPVAP